MKINTFSEMNIKIPVDDLTQLLYRAKQGEIMFHENKANQDKLVRLKKEYTDLKACYEKLRKEVIKMPVKWDRRQAQRPALHENEKPKGKKLPKGEKLPKGNKPPKGEKEVK